MVVVVVVKPETMGSGECTHISLQILVPRVRFHANEVSEHARHHVIAENDDLLPEELQPAGVAREVDLWDF